MRKLIVLLLAIIMTIATVIAINSVAAKSPGNLYKETNLMFGTSPQSPSEYKICNNDKYDVLGIDGDFVFLRVESKTNYIYGYIDKRYFKILTLNDSTLPYDTAQNGIVVNVKDNLNFRFTASTKDNNIIGTIKNGQQVSVLFEENGFYYIDATLNQTDVNARGFVAKKYIKLL